MGGESISRAVDRSACGGLAVWLALAVQIGGRGLVADGQIVFQEQGPRLGGLPDGVYFGMSAADADGDGCQDLLYGRHRSVLPMLTINDGTGAFIVGDPVLVAPLADRDRHTPQWIDFDNDGDKDIFWGSGSGLDEELWQSDGTGQNFVDLWLNANPPYVPGNSRQGVFFDWNHDGYCDVFHIVGRGDPSPFATNEGGTGHFVDRTAEAGLDLLPAVSNFGHGGGGISDYDNDGDIDFFLCHGKVAPMPEPEVEPKFYRQGADRRFVEVLADSLGDAARTRVASVAWGDYDNDGDMDLYLARGITLRDYGRTHNGDGVNLLESRKMEFFSRVDLDSGDTEDAFRVNVSGATQLVLDTRSFLSFVPQLYVGDVNLGGAATHPAALPAVIDTSDPAMLGVPARTKSGVYVWLDRGGQRLQFRHTVVGAVAAHRAREPGALYATGYITLDAGGLAHAAVLGMEGDEAETADFLFRNNGDGTFTDVTAPMGIDNVHDSVLADWADFDNDGDLDLLVINYHYGVPENRPMVLYRNDGAAGFVDVASTAGFAGDLHSVITSLAMADFDNDGDLDFAVAHESGPPPRVMDVPRYYVNQGSTNRWLEVNLVGTASNRDAIGAKLWLTTGSGLQYREQNGGFHAYGQDSMVVHFGTGQNPAADLTIQWPMGGVQTLRGIPTNQRITVVEDTVFADANGDGDVDLNDFQAFQLCFCDSYDSVNFETPWDRSSPPFRGSCMLADADLDGAVELTDFGQFEAGLAGPH